MFLCAVWWRWKNNCLMGVYSFVQPTHWAANCSCFLSNHYKTKTNPFSAFLLHTSHVRKFLYSEYSFNFPLSFTINCKCFIYTVINTPQKIIVFLWGSCTDLISHPHRHRLSKIPGKRRKIMCVQSVSDIQEGIKE